jgi:hypothetical protein
MMKILAMEKETPGVKPEQFTHYLKQEARQVWELYQEGHIREIYFRQDQSLAVLILECMSVAEASQILDSLPLVQARLIMFDLIPLLPYPGFSRLFVQNQ